MDIGIYGMGAIGSVFAYHLAKAGHRVTGVARGARLQELEREGAVVLASGERAPVQARGALDPEAAYDLVMVTLFARQVEAIVPALRASRARKVMFLFNTFEPFDGLREAVGAERFELGFPGGIFARVEQGRVHAQVRRGTVAGSAAWAGVFSRAGIPTAVEADMHVWLRTHAAMVIPLMASGTVVARRPGGLSWAESRRYALAYRQGMEVVRGLGHAPRPALLGALAGLPLWSLTALLWAMNRTEMQRQLGRMGEAEPRMLIDQMTAAAPGRTDALLAIRP